MITRLFGLWYTLRSSLWFTPGLMVAVAIGLSYLMTWVDTFLGKEGITLWWVSFGGVESARSILSTIASSTITVAGVVFSITIVVLSQSASQFGPQLVKNFMQDRSTQLTLGVFSGTFIYSLFTLSSLRGATGETLPQTGITLALLLAASSIIFLINFIHVMAKSIQSNRTISAVIRELDHSIQRALPEPSEENDSGHAQVVLPADFETQALPIITVNPGFLQTHDIAKLISTAEKNDLIISLAHIPGDFVPYRGELGLAWPREHLDDSVLRDLRGAFNLGNERTTEQDIRLSIERLAMIATRALSPSINDPYTAGICVDWLGSSLCRLAERTAPETAHYDGSGRLRVVTRPLRLKDMLDIAYIQIRHSAGSPLVFGTILNSLAHISVCITRLEDRNALMRNIRLTKLAMEQKIPPHDLPPLRRAYIAAVAAVNQAAGTNSDQNHS